VGIALFLALGGLTQIAETFWPLREYVKPKAWRLDLIALAVTLLTRVVMSRTEGPAIARLAELRGLSWTMAGAVSRNVPWPIVLLVSLVVLDGLLYFGHRLLHAPWLWHTHAAHHSVEHLYCSAGTARRPSTWPVWARGGCCWGSCGRPTADRRPCSWRR
jgi:sterol desaturase/sphingolipid hydroxylase (fatty acid hydroxylase superfamily)